MALFKILSSNVSGWQEMGGIPARCFQVVRAGWGDVDVPNCHDPPPGCDMRAPVRGLRRVAGRIHHPQRPSLSIREERVTSVGVRASRRLRGISATLSHATDPTQPQYNLPDPSSRDLHTTAASTRCPGTLNPFCLVVLVSALVA